MFIVLGIDTSNDISDILVSPLKMIFSLTGYVHEQFSFIIKLIKKKIFVINLNKNQPLLIQFDLQRKMICLCNHDN
jgi:hypothetical protein